MIYRILIMAVIILLFPLKGNSRDTFADSLVKALKILKHDTLVADSLIKIAETFQNNDPLRALDLCVASKEISLRNHYTKGITESNTWMSMLYRNLGDVTKALELAYLSLAEYEKAKDNRGIAYISTELAAIYFKNNDYDEALKHYTRSRELYSLAGDLRGEAAALNNIALIMNRKGDTDKAIEIYNECLDLRTKAGDGKGVSNVLSNLGTIYLKKKEYRKAEIFFGQALKGDTENNNRRQLSSSLYNMGELYFLKGNYKEALSFGKQSLDVSLEVKNPDAERRANKLLFTVYKALNDFDKALAHYERFIVLYDSLNNTQTRMLADKAQLRYEYGKKSDADSIRAAEAGRIKDAQLRVQETKLKQERMQFWFLAGGLFLVAGGLVVVVNRFRIARKQKRVIEQQKTQVDEAFEKLAEKNKEVLDSIYYARRIQRALVTNEKYIDKNLKRLIHNKN